MNAIKVCALLLVAAVSCLSQTTTSVDDSVIGANANQFNYVGSGWQHCTNCEAALYDQSSSWDSRAGDYVTVAFTGTQFKFYGDQNSTGGIGAVSIDGGAESNINFNSATRITDRLLWTSPALSSGNHVFKLRNATMASTAIAVDRVDIVSAAPAQTTTTIRYIAGPFGGNDYGPPPALVVGASYVLPLPDGFGSCVPIGWRMWIDKGSATIDLRSQASITAGTPPSVSSGNYANASVSNWQPISVPGLVFVLTSVSGGTTMANVVVSCK